MRASKFICDGCKRSLRDQQQHPYCQICHTECARIGRTTQILVRYWPQFAGQHRSDLVLRIICRLVSTLKGPQAKKCLEELYHLRDNPPAKQGELW